MPTAEPSVLPSESADERPSERTLEHVGPLNVLTALVEHKRRSSIPPASEVEPIVDREPTSEEVAPTERAPKRSDAFLKTR